MIIEFLQGTTQTDFEKDVFKMLYDKLEDKYLTLEIEDEDLEAKVKNVFFPYLRKTWIISGERNWFEGANPWGVSHNNSLERFNKYVKDSYTFRLVFNQLNFIHNNWQHCISK